MVTEVTDQYVGGRQPGGFEEEIIRATIDLGSGGGGSLTGVGLEGDYGGEPVVSADCVSHAADVNTPNKTSNSTDISVANGPASTTVTVELKVTGRHGVS